MTLLIGLKGGLGNQLFQFAHGINISIELDSAISFYWEQAESINNTPRQFELSFLNVELNQFYRVNKLLDNSLILVPIDHKIQRFGLKKKHRQEKFFYSKPLVLKKNKTNIVSGYWQGIKFFEKNSVAITQYIESCLKNTQSFELIENKVSAVHLRFGDYFYSDKIKKIHGVISLEYLQSATELIRKTGIENFHVYTDSNEVASEFLSQLKNHLNFKFIQFGTPLADLEALSCYKSIIGSNSSFSWWASYLGEKNKTVILPRNWFGRSNLILNSTVDLFQSNWITLG